MVSPSERVSGAMELGRTDVGRPIKRRTRHASYEWHSRRNDP